MNEKEAIEQLKIIKRNIDKKYINTKNSKAIKTVLNLIEKKQSLIKEKIEEIKKYRDIAKELIEERVVIADSDSLNYGRAEAHDKDIQVLEELLNGKM